MTDGEVRSLIERVVDPVAGHRLNLAACRSRADATLARVLDETVRVGLTRIARTQEAERLHRSARPLPPGAEHPQAPLRLTVEPADLAAGLLLGAPDALRAWWPQGAATLDDQALRLRAWLAPNAPEQPLDLAAPHARRLGWLLHQEPSEAIGLGPWARALDPAVWVELGGVLADAQHTALEVAHLIEDAIAHAFGPLGEDAPPALFDEEDLLRALDERVAAGSQVSLVGEDLDRVLHVFTTWAARLRGGQGPAGLWCSGRIIGGFYPADRGPLPPPADARTVVGVSLEAHAGPFLEDAREAGRLAAPLVGLGHPEAEAAARKRIPELGDAERLVVPPRSRRQRLVDWLVDSLTGGQAGLVEVLVAFADAERGRVTLPRVPWHGWDEGRGGPLRGWVHPERLSTARDFFDERLARLLEERTHVHELPRRYAALADGVIPGGDLRPYLALVEHLRA